jgi:hypothetical protein
MNINHPSSEKISLPDKEINFVLIVLEAPTTPASGFPDITLYSHSVRSFIVV